MKKTFQFISLLLFISAGTIQVHAGSISDPAGHIAVANRASGTVSIINVESNTVDSTLELPLAEHPSEPMYIVYKNNRLYVGDRMNNRIVVLDSYSFNVIAEIPTGKGVFHMWAASNAQLLMVNNDIDKTVTVIDTNSLEVICTFAVPADLTEQGYKPHDIFVAKNGKSAFVSLVDGTPTEDYVIRYAIRANTIFETARQLVGSDPHLFISDQQPRKLYVTSQGESSVSVFKTNKLLQIDEIPVPNAHGVFSIGKRLYVSNISDGGTSGLYTINAKNHQVIDVDDTPYAVPHNISVTDDRRKIYTTHSGGNQNRVSIFSTVPGKSLPELTGEVTVGLNPFGLAYIPH